MSRSSSLSPSSLNLSYLALFCSSTLDPYLCFRFSAAEAVLSTICLKLSRVATSRFWRLLEFLIFAPIIPRLWRAPALELSCNPLGDWLNPAPGAGKPVAGAPGVLLRVFLNILYNSWIKSIQNKINYQTVAITIVTRSIAFSFNLF